MKKNKMVLLSLLAGTFLTTGFAANTDTGPVLVQDNDVFAAIEAAIHLQTIWNNQQDNYVIGTANAPGFSQINPALVGAQQQAAVTAVAQTQSNSDSTLAQVMMQTYPNNSDYSKSPNNQKNILAAVTSPTGPDTLETVDNAIPPVNLDGTNSAASPKDASAAFTNYSAIFNNFSSTNPTDVQNFINLVSNAYAPIVDPRQVNFAKLGQSNPSSTQLANIEQDPEYQLFKANLRSYAAQQSVALNILNTLIAERTTPSNGGLSPLQMEATAATGRINDPKWYTAMQAASPATVQREILYVLAEIENQLYQQHLDNEQMMSALAIQVLQNTSSERILQAAQQMQVGKVISSHTNQAQQNQQNLSDADRQQAEQEMNKQ